MKRFLTILAVLSLCALLCACGGKQAQPAPASTPEPSAEPDHAAAYDGVLALYAQSYADGNASAEFAWTNGISEYITYSAHAGYALSDLNGDGVPELLIAGMGEEDHSDRVLYDLYTLKDGTPLQLACSSARNRWYLRSDGSLLNEGSGGAGHSVFVLNALKGDALVPTEAVITWFDNTPEDGYYHQTGSYSFEPRPEDELLSEADAWTLIDAWEAEVTVPPLTRIA